MTKSLETSKAKVGDPVNARITEELSDGTIQIRMGSRLIGHVTQAQAYTKENGEARLTIAFDKVILSDGQEIAFHGTMEEYRRPVPNGSTMTSGNRISSDPQNRAQGRPIDPQSGVPIDDPKTSGTGGFAWPGGSARGDVVRSSEFQKVTASGFINKSNFKLDNGALIMVRVQ